MCKLKTKFFFKKTKFFILFSKTQVLPPLNYVYYTWADPLKSRELTVSCGTKKAKLGLTVNR